MARDDRDYGYIPLSRGAIRAAQRRRRRPIGDYPYPRGRNGRLRAQNYTAADVIRRQRLFRQARGGVRYRNGVAQRRPPVTPRMGSRATRHRAFLATVGSRMYHTARRDAESTFIARTRIYLAAIRRGVPPQEAARLARSRYT